MSARPTDGLEEESTPDDPRIASRPGAISTKAMLASVLSMGAVGAGAFFLLHSLVVGGDKGQSGQLVVAEPQAIAAPLATPIPIPISSAPPRPPISTSGNSTATPIAVLESPGTVTPAPRSAPRPKPLPRVRPYPFPGPSPLAAISVPSAPKAEPQPEETSGTNPYDEVMATTTTTRAAPPTPRQAAEVPTEDPYGSRE